MREIDAAAAGTWQLGDLTVNRIGLGTKRLAGSRPTNNDPDNDPDNDPSNDKVRERAADLLRRAVALGVNHIDTAAFYPSFANPSEGPTAFTSLGWANALVREALAPYPEDLVIATKVGPTKSGLARPDQLRALVEADLRDLGRDHLDLVYLRQGGLTSVAEHFGVLADLRDEGLIRHLGLSNVRAEHLAEARSIAPVTAVQNRYAVDFGRGNDELLCACGEAGIAFVGFFTLAAEARETGGVASNETVEAIAGEHGATAAQVRIAWQLSQGAHVLAIPGTSDPDHLDDNIVSGALRLSEDELARLG